MASTTTTDAPTKTEAQVGKTILKNKAAATAPLGKRTTNIAGKKTATATAEVTTVDSDGESDEAWTTEV
jgi:hypothetical protein